MAVSMLSAFKMAGDREHKFTNNMPVPVGDTPEIPYGNGLPVDGHSWATYDPAVGAYYQSAPGGSYYLTPPDTLQDPSLGFSLPHQPEQWWNGYSEAEPTNDLARQLAQARRGSAVRPNQQQRGRREATSRHRPTPIKKPVSRSSLRDRVVEHASDSTRKSKSNERDVEQQSILEGTQVPHPETLTNNHIQNHDVLILTPASQTPHSNTLITNAQIPHQNTLSNTDHLDRTGTAYQHVTNVEQCEVVEQGEEAEQKDAITSTQDERPPPGLLPANWRAGKRPEGNRKNGGVGHFGLEHGFKVLWRRPH